MRKLLSIVLCLVMVFCFTVPAMAETTILEGHAGSDPVVVTGTSESASTDVKVKVLTNPVYKVTVEWNGPIEFIYDFGTWIVDSANQGFLTYSASGWKNVVDKVVTVTNYSNEMVGVEASVTDTAGDGVVFLLNDDIVPVTFDLASADNNRGGVGKGQAVSNIFTVTVDTNEKPLDATKPLYTEELTVTVTAK